MGEAAVLFLLAIGLSIGLVLYWRRFRAIATRRLSSRTKAEQLAIKDSPDLARIVPIKNASFIGHNQSGSAPQNAANRRYRAVGVRPQLRCCQAIRALENTRFLAEEAPHFPVAGCNLVSCRCQYMYFSDRREDDRRSLFGVARSLLPMTVDVERRSEERRKIGS